jgi:hypothetical protein
MLPLDFVDRPLQISYQPVGLEEIMEAAAPEMDDDKCGPKEHCQLPGRDDAASTQRSDNNIGSVGPTTDTIQFP